MSLSDSDISWQLLRRIVHDWAGTSAELAEVTPLNGGSISTTLRVATKDGQKVVLKISPHRVDRTFTDEAKQLMALRNAGLPVPDIYACKLGTLDDPHSYLLLQFMPGVPLDEAKRQASAEQFDKLQIHLAELILKLHQVTGERYQRLTSTEDRAQESWPAFYREEYDPICHAVEKDPHLTPKIRKQIHRIHERLERLIRHDDRPRLLHWDLWSHNLLAQPDDNGEWQITAVLDPNCKFGHVEAELAYMELFHTVTPTFMKHYQQDRKLQPEYHQFRKPVYQLYTLLDHVLLFGQEYLKPLLSNLDRVAALV
jgi:fructosamine-3-kinase